MAGTAPGATAQTGMRIAPLGSYTDVARRIAEVTASSGRYYELSGDWIDAEKAYSDAAQRSAGYLSRFPGLPLVDRVRVELLVSTASLDSGRMLIRLGRNYEALQKLVVAEDWDAAAFHDLALIQNRDASAVSLTAVAYTTLGYINVVEGNDAAAARNLEAAPQIEPARDVAAYVRRSSPSSSGMNARTLLRAWQNRPRLPEEYIKVMQAGVGLIAGATKNRIVSAVGVLASAGIGLFAATPPPR